MVKPGIELEPAYKVMATCCKELEKCVECDYQDGVNYWKAKLNGIQTALEALTGGWPIAVSTCKGITVCHGRYEQTFEI